MISIASLWLPILLSAIFVFMASSVIHMVLSVWHKNDFRHVPDEDAAMSALGSLGLEPGDYLFPHAGSSTEVMRSEAFLEKVNRGPIGILTIMPAKAWTNMAPQMTQWFVYAVVVAGVAAYVGTRTLGAGAEYLHVFQITGTVAFSCYAMALPQRSIWWHQNWATTARSMLDGFVYACLTAGAFAWLWPQ